MQQYQSIKTLSAEKVY